jgi:hypothetical protein
MLIACTLGFLALVAAASAAEQERIKKQLPPPPPHIKEQALALLQVDRNTLEVNGDVRYWDDDLQKVITVKDSHVIGVKS